VSANPDSSTAYASAASEVAAGDLNLTDNDRFLNKLLKIVLERGSAVELDKQPANRGFLIACCAATGSPDCPRRSRRHSGPPSCQPS